MSTPARRESESLLHGSTVTLLSRIAQAALAFGTLALLARTLTAADMGVYFLAQSISGLGTLIFPMGMQGILLRDVGKSLHQGHQQAAAGLARAALVTSARLGLACTFAALCIVLAAFLIRPGTLPVSVAAVALFSPLHASLVSLQMLMAEVFRAHGRVAAAGIWNGPVTAALSFTAIAALSLNGNSISLTVALGITLVAQTAALLMATVALPLLKQTLERSTVRLGVRDSRLFWVNGLAIYAFFQADLWAAAIILPLAEVAVYGAGSRIAQILLMPIEAAEAALPQRIVRLHLERRHQQLQMLLNRTAIAQSILVAVGLILLAVCGEWVFDFVFSNPVYQSSLPVAFALATGGLLRALAGPYPHVLMLCHFERPLTRIHLTWAFVCIPVELVAAWISGPIGTAIGAAFMLGTVSFYGATYAQRHLGVDPSVLNRPLYRQG